MAIFVRPPEVQRATRLSARLQTDPRGVIEAPARPNPGIVIHVGRSVAITCTRAGSRHRGTSVHGDVDIIPGGVSSRWDLEDEDTALILGIPDALLRRVSEESGQDACRVEIANRFQIRDPQLEHIGWAVKTEMESGFLNGDLYLDGLATAIAVHLLKRHSSGVASLSDRNARLSGYRLRRVLAYIEDHIAGELSLAELAGIAGLSISHFAAAFRTAAGQSVHQYVTRRRVERAKDLLREGRQPVGQIAIATGFAHGSHLAYHMRRLLGVLPRDVIGNR